MFGLASESPALDEGMAVKKQQSLAARFHVGWLVQLVIAGLFGWFVVNGLLHL